MSTRAPLTKAPLKFLVDVGDISKRKVWSLNVAELLKEFLSVYSVERSKDLRLYGTVALSSSIIFRMQVESFFLFEKQPSGVAEREELILPSIIEVPYRHESYSTSVEDLLTALEKIIASASAVKPKMEETLVPVPSLELPVDPFIMNIKEALEGFKKKLLEMMDSSHQISFRRMVRGLSVIEVVRHFILSLFVAQEEFADLSQSEDDIIITVLV
jgi:segregation and condensation protein A